ncbi:MAG: GDP-mannose 4,6-dehydratase [Acidimicrobiia bacterium]|nr:GDP-mannose 4,6-dehydratase [Acidimicrobiia bacterium]NNL27956.1 NAD-dependent epimerase/dehydratase family protein [Acidimicrobiia bacterium]
MSVASTTQSQRRVVITGAAGFIGSHLTERCLRLGDVVLGIDNFCDYYDPEIKERNLGAAVEDPSFTLARIDIRDREAVDDLFQRFRPTHVVHLAAMAGVRPSIEQPAYYTDVNLNGTVAILDAAARSRVHQFLIASSSSVYGNNKKTPFAESDPVDYPISPYAASKRSGELFCHSYAHLNEMPVACLRFFTVFGPRQRPDLAISKFLRLASRGEPLPIFGDGSTSRDYTYVDDIIDGVTAAMDYVEDGFEIFNIGGNTPITLAGLLETIERVIGHELIIDRKPIQPGDVNRTWADLTKSESAFGYMPQTSTETGIKNQWQWYLEHETADR